MFIMEMDYSKLGFKLLQFSCVIFLFLDKLEKIYSGFIINWIKIKMKVLLKVFDISYYYYYYFTIHIK